jgi:hypothetical protein
MALQSLKVTLLCVFPLAYTAGTQRASNQAKALTPFHLIRYHHAHQKQPQH